MSGRSQHDPKFAVSSFSEVRKISFNFLSYICFSLVNFELVNYWKGRCGFNNGVQVDEVCSMSSPQIKWNNLSFFLMNVRWTVGLSSPA
jgi:hypothetical protein